MSYIKISSEVISQCCKNASQYIKVEKEKLIEANGEISEMYIIKAKFYELEDMIDRLLIFSNVADVVYLDSNDAEILKYKEN